MDARDRKKSRRVSVMQFNGDMDEMEDANFDRSRYRRKNTVSSSRRRGSGYNDDMEEYDDRGDPMKLKRQRRMTQFHDEQQVPAGYNEDNDETFNQMAQRRLSRVTTATNRSFGTMDDGASYMSDRSRSLVDEDDHRNTRCSTLCRKWTIIVVALMVLHIVTLVAIGVFFGEQQKEIDRHDHLLVKLHQRYEKNSRNIQRLGNDMKFIAKDNTEEGGGGHVNLGGGGGVQH